MPASSENTTQDENAVAPLSSRLDVAVVDHWLIFDCPDCGQTIKIDKKDCMYEIECPSCHSGFEPLLSPDTVLPPKKVQPRKRARKRTRPHQTSPPGEVKAKARRSSHESPSKPTSASLPVEGNVRLTIKQSRGAGSNSEAADQDDGGVLPVRSALELERRRVEATKDTRLHEDEGDGQLDAVIEEQSGGQYKRIRVRTRKKRSTEKQQALRFYMFTGLAACTIIGLCLFVASRIFLKDDLDQSDAAEIAAISQFTDEEPIGAKIGNWKTLVNEFLEVETVDQLLQIIRKPKRLEDVIRAYYGSDMVPHYNVKNVVPEDRPDELLPIGFRKYRMTLGGNVLPFYTEKTKSHGYRLDWESLVGYGTMPWQRFIETKSTKVSTMRVYMSDADYYEAPFADEQKFRVVKLEDPTRKYTVYGYFRKDALKFKNLFADILKASDKIGARRAEDLQWEKRMILEIRYPAGAENSAQVEIVDYLDDTWLRH